MKKLALLIFALVILVQTAVSQSTSSENGAPPTTTSTTAPHRVEVPPEKAKPLRIPRLDKPPVIDGKIGRAHV